MPCCGWTTSEWETRFWQLDRRFVFCYILSGCKSHAMLLLTQGLVEWNSVARENSNQAGSLIALSPKLLLVWFNWWVQYLCLCMWLAGSWKLHALFMNRIIKNCYQLTEWMMLDTWSNPPVQSRVNYSRLPRTTGRVWLHLLYSSWQILKKIDKIHPKPSPS